MDLNSNRLEVAVIGDKDLANGLRLAGLKKVFTPDDSQDKSADFRKIIGELINDETVGIILILEEYMAYAYDIVVQRNKEKKMLPVIIDVPSRSIPDRKDIVKYYEKMIKESIGFDIRL